MTHKTHTCTHIHFSSCFYAVSHESVHNFINDHCKGESAVRKVEQTRCRHMVDSSTTDEKCSDEQRETWGGGETKTIKKQIGKKGEIKRSASKQIKGKCEKQKKNKTKQTKTTKQKKKHKKGAADFSCCWRSLSSFSWSWPRRALLAATCFVTSALVLWGQSTRRVC